MSRRKTNVPGLMQPLMSGCFLHLFKKFFKV